MKRNDQQGVEPSWGSPPGASTQAPSRRRSFLPSLRVSMVLLVLCALAGAGFWAYPRYLGGNRTCLLPIQGATGTAIGIATPSLPMPVIYGQIAQLEDATNPIRFKILPTEVEIRDVHYEGEVFGRSVVVRRGGFRILKIAGKPIAMRSSDIVDGCMNLRGLGKTIVLFSGSFSPTATLVLTPEQIASLP